MDIPAIKGRHRPKKLRLVDLVLVLALTAGAIIAIGLLVDLSDPTLGLVLAMLLVQSAIPLAAIYLVVIRARGLAWADLGLVPAERRWLWRAVLLALVTLPLVALVNYLTQSLAGDFRNPQIDALAPEGFSWRGLAGMLAVVGVVAPIVEEITFRGLLYGWLRGRVGIAAAAGLSAAAFAAAHGIPVLFPALFVQGVVFALLYERSGSLWPPIVLHGVFNMVMTAILYGALAAGLPVG